MEPAVVEELLYARLILQHAVDPVPRDFREYTEPARFVDEILAVMDRLPGKPDFEIWQMLRSAC